MSQIEGGRFTPAESGSKSMSRLAVVRHGTYGSDGNLDARGRQQIHDLGERLIFESQNESALIVSSPALRAMGSAEVLAELLSAQIESHELLQSGSGHPREDLDAAYDLVQARKDQADVLVVVTHLEYANKFPRFVGERDLGVSYFAPLGKGEGVIVDYRSKSIKKI